MGTQFLKHYHGHILLGAIICLPLVFWLAGANLEQVFESPEGIVAAGGKAAALAGLAAYCLMPVLSMRHKAIEKVFGGLDTLYRLHRNIGKITFFIIWAHPVLLLASGIMAGQGLLRTWDWFSLTIVTGIIGLMAFTALTVLTIYSHVKHQKWIRVHRYFGWLLPVLFAHALFARSQIVHNRPLFVYMLALGAIGLGSFLYRSVFGNWLIKKYRYEIAEINRIAETVTELVLKPIGIPITYNSGQFAYLSVESDVIDREPHPFSFSTAPNGPYVRFVVKELGDDTAKMKNLQKGAKAYLEGPFGTFSYRNSNNKNQVWIAGGVGVTPFLSMARSLTSKSGYKIHFVYAAEKLTDAVFLKELLAIEKTIPDIFELTVVNRDISGFVTIGMLQDETQDLTKPDYFICGPPAMLKVLREQLLLNGIRGNQIYTEEFSLL